MPQSDALADTDARAGSDAWPDGHSPSQLLPGTAERRRPVQPLGLGVHADLPDHLSRPRLLLQHRRRHRHRDHPRHAPDPAPARPGVPRTDRVAAAHADAAAGAEGDLPEVQGRSPEGQRGADEALQGAGRQPCLRVPAHRPDDGPAPADVFRVLVRPHRAEHQLDAQRLRGPSRARHLPGRRGY